MADGIHHIFKTATAWKKKTKFTRDDVSEGKQ